MKSDKDTVGREEVQELLRLLEWMKTRAGLGIEQGKGTRKQALRTRLNTGVYTFRTALEEIEQVAK